MIRVLCQLNIKTEKADIMTKKFVIKDYAGDLTPAINTLTSGKTTVTATVTHLPIKH